MSNLNEVSTDQITANDLAEFYISHRADLLNRALKLCNYNPADAEDLLQEAFTKALANIHQFEVREDQENSLRRWLFTIMRNCRVSKIGKDERKIEAYDLELTQSNRTLSEIRAIINLAIKKIKEKGWEEFMKQDLDTLLKLVISDDLLEGIHQTSPAQIAALVLIDILGLTAKEGEALTGIKLKTLNAGSTKGRQRMSSDPDIMEAATNMNINTSTLGRRARNEHR